MRKYRRGVGAVGSITVIPLWLFWLPLGVLGGILCWRDGRRFRPGFCDTCSYSLTGNTSGICPECGTPTSESRDVLN